MRVRNAVVAVALAAVLAAPAAAQELKPWKHGVIEPKGDGGFILMVGQRDFAAKHGLKIEIVKMKNGATAHKALLAGEVDSIESSPGAAILAGAHGADIKIVGCDWPGVPHGLMVRPKDQQGGRSEGQDHRSRCARLAAQPADQGDAGEEQDAAQRDVRFANLGGDLDRYKAVLGRRRRRGHRGGGVHGGRAEGHQNAGARATRCCRITCGCASP